MEEIENSYVVCPACGVNHSTLVKHRCFKQDEAPPPPESEANEGDGDSGEQGDTGKGKSEGEGEGEGKPEEGEGDGEGDGEEEREAPAPQAPEPETPPVAVVCTVLKFAALTADCAKNGSIEVTLTEDGLLVYGNNGDETAVATIPWGEFEKRSTLDGEFYVKQVIDEVDGKLADPSSDERKLAKLIEEAKAIRDAEAAKPKPEPEPPAPVWPAVPLKAGDVVKLRNGRVDTIRAFGSPDNSKGAKIRTTNGWHHADTGRWGGAMSDNDQDIVELVAAAPEAVKKARGKRQAA